MQTVGIKELKTNPSVLTKTIEANDYLLISKRGKPFALTTALDNTLFDFGLKTWLLTRAYAENGLSLGQLSSSLGKSYSDTVKLLSLLNIPVLDYDLADELAVLDELE